MSDSLSDKDNQIIYLWHLKQMKEMIDSSINMIEDIEILEVEEEKSSD